MSNRANLANAIDFHVHFGPDAFRPRRDLWSIATAAEAAGLAGLVIKSHSHPTAAIARLVQPQLKTLRLYGGVVLNYENGGFNTHAVAAALDLGARVVWMPTFSSVVDYQGPEGGLAIMAGGQVRPEVQAILTLIAGANAVLATAHLQREEVLAVVDLALAAGVKKVVVNHPRRPKGPGLTRQDMADLARKGAFLEPCLNQVQGLCPHGELTMAEFAADIRAAGVEQCLVATDMGQEHNPLPHAGLAEGLTQLAALGFRQAELDVMVRQNPRRLLAD